MAFTLDNDILYRGRRVGRWFFALSASGRHGDVDRSIFVRRPEIGRLLLHRRALVAHQQRLQAKYEQASELVIACVGPERQSYFRKDPKRTGYAHSVRIRRGVGVNDIWSLSWDTHADVSKKTPLEEAGAFAFEEELGQAYDLYNHLGKLWSRIHKTQAVIDQLVLQDVLTCQGLHVYVHLDEERYLWQKGTYYGHSSPERDILQGWIATHLPQADTTPSLKYVSSTKAEVTQAHAAKVQLVRA